MMRRLLTTAAVILAAAAVPTVQAQELMADESPDAGFRILGPRTVVSYVRESLPAPDPTDGPLAQPHFSTLIHVSNTGNGPLAGVAIFVNAHGDMRRALRFRLSAGQTGTYPVAAIIGDDMEGLGPLATGIVLVRFFVPVDEDVTDRFYSQMVSAETIQELPGAPPQLLRLDVERPQELHPRPRARR